MTEIVAVISGKGGVGKTSTAINLAAALAQTGTHAVVLDADVTTPNVGLHLGILTTPNTLHDVLKGKKKLSEATYTHLSGIHIIPGSIKGEDTCTSLNSLQSALQDLQGKTAIVLLDSASGIGEEAMASIKAADSLLVVVTPDMISVTDALKTIQAARLHQIIIKGIIVNRVRQEEGELSNESIHALLEAPILGYVPEDKNMRLALTLKQPLMYSNPESPASLAYKKIAGALLGHTAAQETKEHKYWNDILRFIKMR